MDIIKNMPAVGIAVIAVILILFAISLIILFYVCGRYKLISSNIRKDFRSSRFLSYVNQSYAETYRIWGSETNTPAIISEGVSSRLGGLLFCERFLNSAVSLFVTLGLFGTFLGLSLSVSSLTELISFSNTEEWLSVLDSVGGGLMSALSGMGVAFYTSLVGVACSILLTVLKSIMNPQALRESMETSVELWLDHSVAPTLPTDRARNDADAIKLMKNAIDSASKNMEKTLASATNALNNTMFNFDRSIGTFNNGVHEFGEVDYNLRGTVERLDVSIRDFSAVLKKISDYAEGRNK